MSKDDIDYDKYYAKHCARYYGWLPAGKAYQKGLGRNPKKSIKYFTLCGKKAIDIFMFEMEGVISRDKNRTLPHVIICEENGRDALEILELVRPPQKEAIIIGPLEKILTFEDNEHTRGHSPDDDIRNRHIREMVRIKGLSQRLINFFPFDIINFDPYENILNPDKEANKLLYKAFEKVFELQHSINSFLFFITAPISDIHEDFQSRFRHDFVSNVSTHQEISEHLLLSVGTTEYDQLDENKRVAIGFAKSVILSAAKKNGWNSEHKGIYIYQNKSLRKMLSSVVQFSKAKSTADNLMYVKDIIRVIEQMPTFYSYKDSEKTKEVIDHLNRIVDLRDRTRDEFSRMT